MPDHPVHRTGRPRSIDRDRLLDVAEKIVTRDGAGALTIDAVAKSAGVTKGGVQYALGTKEAIVEAMFDRWNQRFDELAKAIEPKRPGPLARVDGHIIATLRLNEPDSAKSAALMAALVRSPDELQPVRAWYRQIIASLDFEREEDRRARLAFLATEGAYMLRFFKFLDIDEDEWNDMFSDITALLEPGEDIEVD